MTGVQTCALPILYDVSRLGTPFGVREILRLTEEIKREGSELRNLLEGFEDPEVAPLAEERRREFLGKAVRIKRHGSEAARKLASMANRRTGDQTRDRLRNEIDALYGQVAAQTREGRLAKTAIEEIIARFDRIGADLARLDAQARAVVAPQGMTPEEFERVAVLSTRRRSEERRVGKEC